MAKHYDQFNPNFNIDSQFEVQTCHTSILISLSHCPLVCMQLAVFLKYLSTPELAQFIPDPPPTSQGGVLLTNVPEFCTSATLGGPCTTAYSQHIPDCVSCGHILYSNVCVCLLYLVFVQGHVDLSDVFFAVKTCEKFHDSRCVLSCWLQSLY